MERQKIAEKVKKLLRLAEDNPFETEAEVAILKAQQLLAKHGLTDKDLAEDPDLAGNPVVSRPYPLGATVPMWLGSLGSTLAENFRCYVYVKPDLREDKRTWGKDLVFLGRERDVDVVLQVFAYARRAAEDDARNFLSTLPPAQRRKARGSFLHGFVAGLHRKLKEQVALNKWEVVLVRDALVKREWGDLNIGRAKTRSVHIQSTAYDHGVAAGHQFDAGAKALPFF